MSLKMAADGTVDCEFPVWGLLPKRETGVVSYLTKNPNYDGRGTVIAIFDSGVDPAAEGLKITSTNETKVIERYDCSGCGDVDTSTIIRKITDGCITGLTGRKLKIPESWQNPTGEWRVGVLHPFSLYPTKLKERIQEHRKEHFWDVGHKPAFAEANKQLHEFENDVVSKNSNLSPEDKLRKEELEARVEVLQAAEKKYTDVGPTYDCVLFHDGTVWCACIDTSESGDLSSGPVLREFSATQDHSHLTPLDEMTISVNVHDGGDTLEVVGMCSTHGTHVAAIAAGYFPDEPDKNGVAPGAKIISLTIGDSRLGSMETGTALVRACIKVMELSKKMKIDVINMSYGEHAHWSNAGRVGDVICEVVNRYGCSWVVSAGNHGPALCTVGAPPDIAQPILIGVGAYVSPEMMLAAYSMRARWGGGAFSWSSRGPAPDGAQGVTVCAPGGALAPVARFTLRNTQLMNGTSMAAPHVAGAVAVLISGLKAKQLPYSPYSVKRALENSATFLSHVEPWAQGCGLLNVEKAFEILVSYHSGVEREVWLGVSCGALGGKGVLLRPRADDPPKDVAITIEPHFLQNHLDVENREVISKQISFGVRLSLCCAAPWVSAPRHLDLANAPRPLAVRVDTAALSPGPHYTSINFYDVSCVEKGPVLRVPVTVLQPEPLPPTPAGPQLVCTAQLFQPATVRRHYVMVPAEASWAVLRMSTADRESSARFLVHALQLVPRRSCRSHETQKMISLSADSPAVMPFQLIGGVPLELVISKYWANLGDVVVDYSVEFRGVVGDFGQRVVFTGGEGVRSVLVTALRHEELQPSAQLKHSETVLRPSESKLSPLTSRDVIPPARQIYHLVNTYNFHIAKATEVSPIVSMLSDTLYECELESQMWMLYNSNKQLLGVGDAYPTKYSVKVEKGDYVLRLNVRHDNKTLLEKLQELPVILQQRLSQPIALDAYSSYSQAVTGGKKFSSGSASNGVFTPLYFTGVPADKISRSSVSVGYTLSGCVTFVKDELGRRVTSAALQYVVPDPPRRNNNNNNNNNSNNKDKDKNKAEDYTDAYKEFTTNWISKLEGDKLEQVYEESCERFPGHPAVHLAYLSARDPYTDHKRLPHADVQPDVTTAWCEQTLAVADKVLKQIEQEKLLAYLGMKHDTRPDAHKIKLEHEKQRGWVVEALSRRGSALCRLHALNAPGASRDRLLPTISQLATDLAKFTDLTDTKAINFGVWHSFTLKHWGRAVKLLNKLQEERPSREVDERLAEVYRQLGWEYLARHTHAALPARYPAGYRPF